ncbi:MAG: hypothetical protein PVJ66_05670 [Gammaproteobacteria bacterium]
MAKRKDRRTTRDRRINDHRKERSFRCNRRHRPDRRLNSIITEWIPMEHISLHPVTRKIFARN